MRITAIATVAALFVAAPAYADVWDFVLTNASGKEIKTIELAPTGTTNWQPNKVEPNSVKTFKNNDRTTIHFDKNGSDCKFDIKATFNDATSAVWSNVNVCDDNFVTIKMDASGATTFSAN